MSYFFFARVSLGGQRSLFRRRPRAAPLAGDVSTARLRHKAGGGGGGGKPAVTEAEGGGDNGSVADVCRPTAGLVMAALRTHPHLLNAVDERWVKRSIRPLRYYKRAWMID